MCYAICDWVRGGDRWCWILITSDQQLTRKLSLSGAQIPVAATALCSGDMRGHSDVTQVLLWHCASVWIICGYKNQMKKRTRYVRIVGLGSAFTIDQVQGPPMPG